MEDNSQVVAPSTEPGVQEKANESGTQEQTVNIDKLQDELKSVRREAASHRTKNGELNAVVENLKAALTDRDNEINTMKTSLKQNKIKQEFSNIANNMGVIDVDAAFKLADTSNIEFDNDDVKLESVKNTLEKLKEAYPFVFKTGANTDIDAASGGKTPNGGLNALFRSL